MSSNHFYYVTRVTTATAGFRLDRFLSTYLSISRNKAQKLIHDHQVFIDGSMAKSNYITRLGDEIHANFLPAVAVTDLIPEDLPLDILYEDGYLMVVNKPAQMVVHPDAVHQRGTLANALVYRYTNLPFKDNIATRPGLVHRLDRGTSGLLVVAKKAESLAALAKQFYDRSVKRIYYALVWGNPKMEEGCIDVPIGKQGHHQIFSAISSGNEGKRAVTHYRIVERFHRVTLVACRLETGRTHQIRVHMQHIGHPLFGDLLYGGRSIVVGEAYASYKAFIGNCFKWMPYQALHAAILGFNHPVTGVPLLYQAPLPENFVKIIEKWRRYGMRNC